MFSKKISLSYVLTLGLCLINVVHADYYQTQNTTGTSFQAGTFNDQELDKKIHNKIGSGWFTTGYDHVTVQVNDGVVTLGGYVKTLEDKVKVEKEVRNIPGVRDLNSQISLQDASSTSKTDRQFPQDNYATPADDQLNKKIRDDVSRGWLWNSYKDVTLNTVNGVVTLNGTVDSIKDQQKLINEIQKVNGVKSIKSNLKIKNS